MCRLYLTFLFIFASSFSYGFGASAHRIISEIAQANLSEAARAAIDSILIDENIISTSTWADEMRNSPVNSEFWSYQHSSNWHFVNIDNGQNYQQSTKQAEGDAYLALQHFLTILTNNNPRTSARDNPIGTALSNYFSELSFRDYRSTERKFALKFLIHLVADLHQPLHVGYKQDRGGNDIKVTWFNTSTNLHSVWDSRLLQAKDMNYSQLTRYYFAKIESINPQQQLLIQQAPPSQWLEEALKSRSDIYDVDKYNSDFSAKYVEDFTPLFDQQIINAGLRLGYILNTIFK